MTYTFSRSDAPSISSEDHSEPRQPAFQSNPQTPQPESRLSRDHAVASIEEEDVDDDTPVEPDEEHSTHSYSVGRSPEAFQFTFQAPTGHGSQGSEPPEPLPSQRKDKGKGPRLVYSSSPPPARRAASHNSGSRLFPGTAGASAVPQSSSNSFDMRGIHSELRHTASASGIDFAAGDDPSTPRPQPLTSRSLPNSPLRGGRTRMNSAPHRVEDEEPPDNRFYDTSFQEALTSTKTLMANLATVLSSGILHQEHGSVAKELYETATFLSRFSCSTTRTIGFVGDSGVGKSSVINCLLNVKRLAPQDSRGTACTAIATEYSYHPHEHLNVTVHYFTRDDIRVQMRDHISAYRELHGNSKKKNSNKEMPEDPEFDQHRAKLASDTFTGVFGSRFSHQTLLDEPEDDLLTKMMGFINGSGVLDSEPARDFETVEMCSEFLSGLASSRGAKAISPWPLINKISVKSNAWILRKGLILVDLPGLRDVNSARQAVTERYLVECDEAFAVARMTRALTDLGVEKVFELAQTANLKNVGIICTHSDEVDTEDVFQDCKTTNSLKDTAAQIAKFRQDIKQDGHILADLESRNDELCLIEITDMSPQEKTEQMELTRDIGRLRSKIKRTDLDLRKVVMARNNEDITRQLHQKYNSYIPDFPLVIHSVSNADYMIHLENPGPTTMPYLLRSGIIALRKHCIGIVADSQLHAATRFLKDTVSAFLNKLQLWVRSGADNAQQRMAIRNAIDEVDRKLKRDLNGPAASIQNSASEMQRVFRDLITNAQDPDSWCRTSTAASQDWWEGLHHSSYAAFCKKYGEHRVKKCPPRSWNEEATTSMKRDLSQPWISVIMRVKALMGGHLQSIDDAAVRASAIIHTLQGADQDALIALDATIRHTAGSLFSAVEELHEVFQANMRVLVIDALGTHRTSITGSLLEQTYNDCRAATGDGSTDRKHEIISGRLENVEFFEEHHRRVKRDYVERTKAFQVQLRGLIDAHLAEVQATLNILRNDNAAAEGERDPGFRQRVAVATHEATESFARIKRSANLDC